MTVLMGRRPKEWLGEQLEKSQPMVLIEVIKSPAQGAMFAPLALKFV